ncbi:MAG TPA: alpha-L-fucosidase [Woeseiaceae bacterium]|nr:alpha-L-fucosidase [Woeseiaceae bacterium]
MPAPVQLPIASGPFQPAASSLKTYETPAWFRDAKFGIWAHWGPQAVLRSGDWYARWMYVPGHPHYAHHLEHYGHPSELGYKDIIPLWKAEKFDPEALMDLYVAAGAKYFVSMGVHHDNFDLWNSRHHRWNALAMGPERDIVGAWRDAARRRGLRFGVSEHLGASHNWFYPSHQYDQFWPKIGVDYDGADPQYADLYHPRHDEPYKGSADTWYTTNPEFHQIWFNRIRDLVDSYEPDLLYTDGGIPFGKVGRSLVAHHYNSSIARHGRLEAVYTCKELGSGEFYAEACVQDVERGVMSGINPLPWQTDTSNGDWYYAEGAKYKTAADVIRMLADIVSKNGNLLLNVVLYPDGHLPAESQTLLSELAHWMNINAEAIHGTRPWTVHGEGPTETVAGAFKESAEYTADDIRFTTKAETLYAITLGEPRRRVVINSLGRGAGQGRRAVRSMHLLGVPEPLKFQQTDAALVFDLPHRLPTRHASAFRISFGA